MKLMAVLACVVSIEWDLAYAKTGTTEDNPTLPSGTPRTREAVIISKLKKVLLSVIGVNEDHLTKEIVNVPPPHLVNLHRHSSEMRGNTVRALAHVESVADAFHPQNKMLFHFNLSSVPDGDAFRYAELRISQSPRSAEMGGVTKRVIVKAYEVVRPQTGSRGRLLGSLVTDGRSDITLSFDVSRTLERWLDNPEANNGIYVEVLPLERSAQKLYRAASHVRLRRNAHGPHDSTDWKLEQPLLVLHTDDAKLKPMAMQNGQPGSVKVKGRHHCRRYSLNVNFKELGWGNWIVSPESFNANYCDGACSYPLAQHTKATNHATLQGIMHFRNPTHVVKPCCVPDQTSPMSVLYVDSDGTNVIKSFPDMIAESCSCR